MAITFTQTLITAINTTPNATTATGKFGAAATAGKFVVAIIKVSGGNYVTSVSDTRGNTWVNPAYNLSSGPDVEVWYTYVTTGIQTNDLLTVVASGGTNQITNIIAASFSGVGTYLGSYEDLTTGALTTSASAATTKTIALGTTIAPDLIIAAVGTAGSSSQTFTSSTGTVVASTDATKQTALVYQIQSAKGSANPAITWTTSASYVYAGVAFFPLASTNTTTTTSKARIQKSFTSTTTSKARIQNSYTSNETSKARVQNTLTSTQTSVSRITKTFTSTQTSLARIAINGTSTQTSQAILEINGSSTQTSQARLTKTSTTTQSSLAKITVSSTSNTTSKARIQKTLTSTQTSKASISASKPHLLGMMGVGS